MPLKASISALLLYFCCIELFSQGEPVAAFSSPTEICIDEPGNFLDQSSNAVYTEWDFCDQDFDGSSTVSPLGTLDGLGRTLGADWIEFEGTWYAFVTSWDQNRIFRLRFGNGLQSAPTEMVDLGNPAGLLDQPVSINVVSRSSKWYLLVHNWGSSSISRVDMGQNLLNVPLAAITMTTSAGGFPTKMDIVDTSDQLKAVLVQANGSLKVIDFENDPELPVAAVDIMNTPPIPDILSARDVALINEDDKWFAFVSVFSPVAIYRLEFGSDIMDGLTASPLQIAGAQFQGRINNIEVTKSGFGYYLHVLTLEGGLFKVNLPMSTSIPAMEDIMRYGQAVNYNEGYVLKFVKDKGQWRGFTFQDNVGANPKLYGITSAFDCGENVKYSIENNPVVRYSRAGSYPVTLKVVSIDGHTSYSTKEIVINNKQAPFVDFSAITFCETSPVTFDNLSDEVMTSNSWSFGDGNMSAAEDPSHQYASSGKFMVRLEVEAMNGCHNVREKEITVYNPPPPGFNMPPGLICTNNLFTLPNTTPDTYNGNLSYQWFVDDNPVSTGRDLHHTFTTTGPKDIKLITSIPGCSNEIIKTTPSVQTGPVVDFSVTGACEGDLFSFQNEISDPVETYLWNFDNGNTSSDPNPTEQFTSFGDYSVSLTVTNAIGCENVKTGVVTVHSKPVIDFSAEGPPNACSGTSTLFTNGTTNPDGGEITDWLWDFNDSNDASPSSETEPEHIFALPGTYPVSLAATTASGCVGTGEKNITIHESPSTDFDFATACQDVPVLFTGPPDANIMDSYWEIGTSYYEIHSPTHTFRSAGDFPLYMEVTAANGCIGTREQSIHVPEPLTPDFSVLKNCVDEEAVFTDITTGSDAVVATEWLLYEAATFTNSPLRHTFTEQENQQVTMKVTTVSGCEYAVSKSVEIFSGPEASFSSSPRSGAYPLEVKFTNDSQGATHFQWDFADESGATSPELSPVHTFQNQGAFEVVLTAFNAQECADSFTEVITTVTPLPDAAVEQIILTPGADGSLKLIVTIQNKGNSVLKNAPLEIAFSGSLVLRHVLTEPILPATKYNFVLGTGIVNDSALRYLCVSLELEHDLNPQDNRFCKEFEDKLLVLPAYPNPAKSVLYAEWISGTASLVRISLLDAMGRMIFHDEMNGSAGINRQTLDLSGLPAGIYYLLTEDGLSKDYQRILVIGEG